MKKVENIRPEEILNAYICKYAYILCMHYEEII